MNVSNFVESAVKQDSRNKFCRYDGELYFIPEALQYFFRNYNPDDVEVTMFGNQVSFYSVEDLEVLQEEYLLDEGCFVFATCNSDPIYVSVEGAIFTKCHGVKNASDEKIAEDFSGFLELIDE